MKVITIVENNVITGVRYGTADATSITLKRDAARAYERAQRIKSAQVQKVRREHTKKK